jgi:hypothetical protein
MDIPFLFADGGRDIVPFKQPQRHYIVLRNSGQDFFEQKKVGQGCGQTEGPPQPRSGTGKKKAALSGGLN